MGKARKRMKSIWGKLKTVFGSAERRTQWMQCEKCGSRYPLHHLYGNWYVCRYCWETRQAKR